MTDTIGKQASQAEFMESMHLLRGDGTNLADLEEVGLLDMLQDDPYANH